MVDFFLLLATGGAKFFFLGYSEISMDDWPTCARYYTVNVSLAPIDNNKGYFIFVRLFFGNLHRHICLCN